MVLSSQQLPCLYCVGACLGLHHKIIKLKIELIKLCFIKAYSIFYFCQVS